MDLTLSKRGDYVVRAAISLARTFKATKFRKIREIAEEMDMPLRFTPQILNQLRKAGLAESLAGPHGGYRLARPPEKITLLEVVEAGEGSLRPRRCTMRGGPCHWENMCPLHPAWEAAAAALAHSLQSTALSSVAQMDARLESGDLLVDREAHPLPTRRQNPQTA